jgi:hypothetical protein
MMPTEAFLDEEPPPSSKTKRSSKKYLDESRSSSKKSSSKKPSYKTKEDDDRSSLRSRSSEIALDDVSSKRSSTKNADSSQQMSPSEGYSEEVASSREKKKKKKSKDGKSSRSSKSVKASSSKDRSKSSSPESIVKDEDVKVAPRLAGLAPISRDSAVFTVRKGTDVGMTWDRFSTATKTPPDNDGFDDSDSYDSSNHFSAASIASGFSMPILPQQSSHSLSQRKTRPLPPGLASPSRPGAVAVSNSSERIQDMMDRKFHSIEEQKEEEEGEAMPEVVVGAHHATALPARIQQVLDRKFDQFDNTGMPETMPSASQEEGRIRDHVQEKLASFPSSHAASSRRIDQHLNEMAADELATQESIVVQPTAAMTFTAWNYGKGSARHSVVAPPPSVLTNNLIDDQEFALSGIERKEKRLAAGLCAECGRTKTHEKIKYGPFQAFRRMEPLTTPGQVYKGYCLFCNNIFDLRRYLHEPYLREQDLTGTTSAALLVEEAPINMPSSDESVEEFMPKTRRIQVCLCIGVIALIVGIMGLVIFFVSTVNVSQDAGPEQTVSPTAAPGPLGFHQMGADISEPVLSFGYKVAISTGGNRVAVSSPKALQGTGRADIYEFDDSNNWVSMGPSILGDSVGDEAGFGMGLSDDGESVILGYPGNGNGFVRVFRYSQSQWQQVGSTLMGETSGGRFGASVAINPDGSNIIVGAPNDSNDNGVQAGRARVYRLGVDKQWANVGSDLLGSAASDSFGTSVAISDDGKVVAVGAPNNDNRQKDGGQVHVFHLDEDNPEGPIWVEPIDEMMRIVGESEGHEFGTVMSMNGKGNTVVSSAINADNDEGIQGGGDPRVVYIDDGDFGTSELGYGLPAIPGTVGLGCSIDIDFEGVTVVASTLNYEGRAGKAMAYDIMGDANWLSYPPGVEFGGEELGPSEWLGRGPSVSLSSTASHFAIGYESIVDSQSRKPRPVVQVYYYGHGET